MQSIYEQLCDHHREIGLLNGVESLLSWDQQTKMPSAAGTHRAEQSSALAGMIHAKRTDPRIGEWLEQLQDSPFTKTGTESAETLTELKRDYDRSCKVPQKLVEALTHACAIGHQVWVDARKEDDFDKFAPQLEEIVKLTREKADAIGFEDCRYDALLDEYEPRAKTDEVRTVLSELGDELSVLVREIGESGQTAPSDILRREYPVYAQRRFSSDMAKRIGFDFDAGRIDETQHPFCTTLGPRDCRITTRYAENYFNSAFFGTLHEAGHGIYEQGLPNDQYGLPGGQAASLGIHESQSRLWENFVGRSHAFWTFAYPLAQREFPTALKDVASDEFFWAINDVRPSLIRVEADEATYNLHIIIRFELEQELIDGRLDVADLPSAWNERYQRYLGIQPDSAANGVLQDVHWSIGLFGYFATYSLGNLYAAQLFRQAQQDINGLDRQISEGEFDELKKWLQTNVHASGRRKPATQLVADICGEGLSSAPLLEYLRYKLSPLYSLGSVEST